MFRGVPRRLMCDGIVGYTKGVDDPRPWAYVPVTCEATLIGGGRVDVLRALARDKHGWRVNHPTLGDRCPAHRAAIT